MIKPCDHIPKKDEKNKSVRAEIRKDFMQALEDGVKCFEFVGYQDYKYLQRYAAEEIIDMQKRLMKDRYNARKEEYDKKRIEKKYGLIVDWNFLMKHPMAKASSMKDEKQGRRVFCEILSKTVDELLEEMIEEENNQYKITEERRRRNLEKLSVPK